MQFELERLEKNELVLEIDVSADEVTRAVDQAYRSIVRRINIPGFRRGKAPRPIFDRHVGREALYEEAAERLLNQYYIEAVRQAEITPVTRPRVEPGKLEEGQPFKFKATVEVKPEVELGDYRTARERVERGEPEVEAAEIDEHLKGIADRRAQLVDDNESPVAPGSFVVIDLEGDVEGTPYPDSKLEGVMVEIGAGRMPPGLEDGMMDMRQDETRRVEVDFPGDYPDESVRGKHAVFQVTVKEIKRREVPELTDDLARELGEYESLEDLRADVTNRLRELKQQQAAQKYRDEVVQKVADEATVELGEGLVEQGFQRMWRDLLSEMEQRGLTLDTYLTATGKAEEEVRAEVRQRAERAAKRELVLEAVAAAEEITAADAEVEAEIGRLTQMYQTDDVRGLFDEPDRLERLKDSIVERKTVGFLVEGSIPDLSRPMEATEGPAAAPAEGVAPVSEGDPRPSAPGEADPDGSMEAGGPEEPVVPESSEDEEAAHEDR